MATLCCNSNRSKSILAALKNVAAFRITVLPSLDMAELGNIVVSGMRKVKERIIHDSERLIMDNYTGDEDIPYEIEQASLSDPFPGYPTMNERIPMTNKEIAKWKSLGSRQSKLPIPVVSNHPNYLSGLKQGKTDVYDPNDDGLPLIPEPYLTMFLKSGAAVRGTGFFWKFKTSVKNPAGDSVVVRERDGKLQILVIERADMPGKPSLPGGMEEDSEELDVPAAIRELFEEAGVDLRNAPREVVLSHKKDPIRSIAWGDPRMLINAIPVSSVILVTPPSSETENMKFNPNLDEALKVDWIDACEKNLSMKCFSVAAHARFIKLAIKLWQEKTGYVISKDGSIGKAAQN